eukprot:gb/GFBE01023061.1/.p1 GENE.gb/GFBE01023061.1/~~gb/GFBE01023061.1/.p1  ORF type:complete len:308 (+),score=55.70 gb/GFBE01023061.1/:1-924(+)
MGSAASTTVTQSLRDASESDLRQFLKDLSPEDFAKLSDVTADAASKKPSSSESDHGMAGEYSFTDSFSNNYSVKLHASGKVMIQLRTRDDCRDAGGPDLLSLTYFYGRWTAIDHDGQVVVLIATASTKKGTASTFEQSACESDIKDWNVESSKGFMSMAAGVLASYDMDTVLHGGRGHKVGPVDSLEDADYGKDSPSFSEAFKNFEVVGKYGHGGGADATTWYLHPEGGVRFESRTTVMLGTWKRVHTNIIELTFVKCKDLADGEVKERVSTESVFVNEKQLQDTSTSPIYRRDEAFTDSWPSMDQF